MGQRKLITKAVEKKLDATPLYSTDGIATEAKPVLVKFFNPYGAGTWIVFEAEREANGDWRFFGLADLGSPELGYFVLSDLIAACRKPWGGLERDQYGPAFAFVANGILCEAAR